MIEIIKNIHQFFKKSYKDKVAFYSELAETILLVTGSAVLAFTILDPATRIFVPLYLFGSMLALISTYRRGSTAILLVSWFTIMNTWAFIQLFIL